jgi:putative ABC transport system permease protein
MTARRQKLPARFATMARIGWHLMTFHRLRLLATLLGVVFATILCNQALGTMFGLMDKVAMVVRRTEADIWIVPRGTQALMGSKVIPISSVYAARGVPGVALAMPLLFAGGSIRLPNGGSEPIQLIGTAAPHFIGGPWNLVQGRVEDLGGSATIIMEDSERETYGGVNIGSRREINERLTTIVGFTWGLAGIGANYAFAEYDYARELGNVPSDQTSFGVVRLSPGADAETVRAAIAAAAPDTTVLTKSQLDDVLMNNLLRVSPIGVTFSAIAGFGVVIGFIIVSLSIFSAVSDNLREFGTLKAVGARSFDLALLMFAQAVAYGVLGSLIGLGMELGIARAISSAKLFLIIPPWLLLASLLLMTFMCLAASFFSLIRLWRVEPGMVFR